jgi:hypothetical protein
MNIEQADRILKKINLLFETMALDDKIDVFEQDLMLSYIRQLKEAFTTAETTAAASRLETPVVSKTPEPGAEFKSAQKSTVEKPAPKFSQPTPRPRRNWSFPANTLTESETKEPAPLPVVEKPAVIKASMPVPKKYEYKPEVKKASTPTPKKYEPKPEVKKASTPAPKKPEPKPEVKKASKPTPKAPEPKPRVKTALKAIAAKLKASAVKAALPKSKAEKKPAPTPRYKAPDPAPSRLSITKPKKPSDGFSKSDYEDLFDYNDAEELLKLRSQMPIKDLTKVMLSREKKSTIKDLFGGDSEAFDKTLKTLNTFKSYNQAKTYLADNIAAKYDWLDKSRKEKTADFIMLVRRRYN